jgi:hypothetical protein
MRSGQKSGSAFGRSRGRLSRASDDNAVTLNVNAGSDDLRGHDADGRIDPRCGRAGCGSRGLFCSRRIEVALGGALPLASIKRNGPRRVALRPFIWGNSAFPKRRHGNRIALTLAERLSQRSPASPGMEKPGFRFLAGAGSVRAKTSLICEERHQQQQRDWTESAACPCLHRLYPPE